MGRFMKTSHTRFIMVNFVSIISNDLLLLLRKQYQVFNYHDDTSSLRIHKDYS